MQLQQEGEGWGRVDGGPEETLHRKDGGRCLIVSGSLSAACEMLTERRECERGECWSFDLYCH